MKFSTTITAVRQQCYFLLFISFLFSGFTAPAQSVAEGSGINHPVAAGTYYAANNSQYAWDEIHAKDPTHSAGVSSMVTITLSNYTSATFNAIFTNVSTSVDYNFVFYPGTTNEWVGQIPYGTYDVQIYGSTQNYYNFYVLGGVDTEQWYFYRNNLDFSCNCGHIMIEDF